MARKIVDINKDTLYSLYITQKMSTIKIAKQFGCNTKTIYKKLCKYEIPVRTASESGRKFPYTERTLSDLYYDQNKTIIEISKELGFCIATIYFHFRKYGITTKLRDFKGDKNPMYGKKGALSPAFKKPEERRGELKAAIRGCPAYKTWRLQVYQRDNFTCQKCGDAGGGNLNADHIVPFSFLLTKYRITSFEQAQICDKLWDLNNGMTLCISCHRKTETYGNKAKIYD